MKTTPKQHPESIVARVLAEHLSPNELYNKILDDVTEDEFEAMENALIGDNPCLAGTTEADQRQIARQEACFLLGFEIGKRIGGAR
jgi:hypothetical protein